MCSSRSAQLDHAALCHELHWTSTVDASLASTAGTLADLSDDVVSYCARSGWEEAEWKEVDPAAPPGVAHTRAHIKQHVVRAKLSLLSLQNVRVGLAQPARSALVCGRKDEMYLRRPGLSDRKAAQRAPRDKHLLPCDQAVPRWLQAQALQPLVQC